MFNFSKVAAATVVATAMTAGAASAATQSFVDTDFSDGFSASGFDSALGTLTQAEVSLSAATTGEGAFTSLSIGVDALTAAFATNEIIANTATQNAAPGTSISQSIAGVFTSAADLADFIDAFSIFGDVAVQAPSATTGTFSVTYTYDEVAAPVPLPAGAPLLLAGLGAFAYARRRQAKKA